MRRPCILFFCTLLLAGLTACPVPTTNLDPDSGGGLIDSSQADAGVEEEETALGQMGEACESSADCEMDDCLNLFSDYGFKGYCSMRCSEDTECSAYNTSDSIWSCRTLGSLGKHCVMECSDEDAPKTTLV